MALASYSDLVSELGDWLNRADLSAKIPTFIRLFEARMNRRLRSPDMEQQFTFTTVARTLSYAISSRVRELREVYAATSTSTDAENYTVTGETIVFDEDPGEGLEVTYSAYVTLSALNEGNTTNWLLDDHPDVYLYGSLCLAYEFIKDEANAAHFLDLWEGVLNEITREANMKRLPAGPLQSQPAVRE